MKKLMLLGLLLVGLSAFALADEYTFYIVSHGGPGDPFWGVVMKGMQNAAAFLNKATMTRSTPPTSGPRFTQ